MRPHPLTGQLESTDPGGAGLDLALRPSGRKLSNPPGASSH